MTLSALLIALSFIGSLIKFMGTIALDSLPGYFAALFISPLAGGAVAALGHLLTALTSGFPMTLPMHIMLILVMGITAYIFGVTYNKSNGIIACIVATILNGPVSTLIASITATALGLPFSGAAMFSTLVVPLTLASAVNIVLGYVIYKIIKNKRV
jgi:uncharacterized membrane protein